MPMTEKKPGSFPLDEDRPFLSEREWTCLRLICHSEASIADSDPHQLAEATAHQIDPERAARLVEIARMARLPGLGTWMARLLVEAGVSINELTEKSADALLARVNTEVGYPICNAATIAAFSLLQAAWRNTSTARMH
jgi:Domain of unknown function (DUF4332)